MAAMTTLTWQEVYERLGQAPRGLLWGVPRGGAIVAGLTGRATDEIERADAIVDDLVDSGATLQRYAALYPGKPFWALYCKSPGEGWVRFPWEDADPLASVADNIRRVLQFLGEDTARDGLRDTPKRVVKALDELTQGRLVDPAQFIEVQFQGEGYRGPVEVRRIPFTSLCEHHLLPFSGRMHVAYVPADGGRIVGLSKIPRLVQALASRLQTQERLTQEVAQTLYDSSLAPKGVGVVCLASHSCMRLRGIRSSGQMRTEAFLGLYEHAPHLQAALRQEL